MSVLTPWWRTASAPARRWAYGLCPAKDWTVNSCWILASNFGHDLDCLLRWLTLHDQPGLEHAEPGTMRYRLYHLSA